MIESGENCYMATTQVDDERGEWLREKFWWTWRKILTVTVEHRHTNDSWRCIEERVHKREPGMVIKTLHAEHEESLPSVFRTVVIFCISLHSSFKFGEAKIVLSFWSRKESYIAEFRVLLGLSTGAQADVQLRNRSSDGRHSLAWNGKWTRPTSRKPGAPQRKNEKVKGFCKYNLWVDWGLQTNTFEEEE